MLRRHRYEVLHGQRPWELSGDGRTRPAAAVTVGEAGDQPPRLSDYPDAEQRELDALQVRRDPGDGTWRWRRIAPSGTLEEISVRLVYGRLQCELPKYLFRTEGDSVAVAWPGLRLVELGNYAEVLHRAVDARLPWLPHRSNAELARLFDVSEAKPEEVHGSAKPLQADAVWLRMVPAGLARDGNSYLLIAYARDGGYPLAWESYVDGKLSGRIRFAGDPTDREPGDAWIAVQEDIAGRELARWEQVESSNAADQDSATD